MVQYDDKQPSPVRRRKVVKSEEGNLGVEKREESFLICDDCQKNSIRYNPAKRVPVIVAVIKFKVNQ